jgi:4-amino-4-deoxy-L-arabinose transferase-like glycosyltransferase
MKRLHTILLWLTLLLCLLRFAYLRADFPNHTAWMIDQAKFTDEGWWANGAVRHYVIGHWQIAGDYNPAIVLPVWPLLLTALFHFTGVSLVAARTISVLFSVATVALVYLLARRYSNAVTAAAAALLLAASPFAFAFARLATLDTILVFEWCLMLWIASFADATILWPLLALGILIPITLLTKTTALVLLPAVYWLLFQTARRHLFKAFLVTGVLPALVMGIYLWTVLHSRYADDYHYFFDINALADIDPRATGYYLRLLLQHGFWIDRILYPATMAALLLSLTRLRSLWRNPLYTACWIALAGQAAFILRRQDDFAPRYFLPMLVPIIVIVVLSVPALASRHRGLAWLPAAVLAVACLLDATQVIGFLRHRQYQFRDATASINAIIRGHPGSPQLLLGTSADQLSLMTGIPAINDGYSFEELHKRVASDQPGWYLGWNDLDQDILAELSAYRLQEVAAYRVFDNDQRDVLILYRMQPAKPEP